MIGMMEDRSKRGIEYSAGLRELRTNARSWQLDDYADWIAIVEGWRGMS